MPKRIGIIGSRRRASNKDYEKVEKVFLELYDNGDWLVSGHCHKGADEFCERIMEKFGVPTLIFPARWKDWHNNWRVDEKAGFERNTWIAENSDLLICAVSVDRSGGTEDTLRKFKRMGHPDDDIVMV